MDDVTPQAVPSPWRTFRARVGILARALRILVALALILLSIWSLLLPVSVPISTTAAVTARLASVPAPIRGEVVSLAADTGDRVGLGSLLAEVSNNKASDDTLVGLRVQRSNLETQLAGIASELQATMTLKGVYEARAKDYGDRIVLETERLVAEAERQHATLVAAKELEEASLAQLCARRDRSPLDVVSDADIARARHEIDLAEKTAAVAAAKVERLRAHVADARNGYYVALGVDPPRYPSLLEDVEAQLAKLTVNRSQVDAQAKNLEEEIKVVEQRHRAQLQRRVASPVKGVVWNRPVNVGQFVDVGSDLYRVADDRTVHVQAYFHRRYLDGLAIGHKASVYLVAARRVVTGTVRVIQAIDAGRGREAFAIDLPSPDEDHFKVLIELDEEGRKLAEIGGVAKIAVLGKLDGRLEEALMWLYLRFES